MSSRRPRLANDVRPGECLVLQVYCFIALFTAFSLRAEDGRPGRVGNDWLLSPRHADAPATSRTRTDDNSITSRLWSENSRIYTSSGSLIRTTTLTPINLAVYTKFGTAVSSFDHQIIHQTDTHFDLVAVDVPDAQELWDSEGRATLAPSYLICRVSHKGTISDAAKAGLTLGVVGQGVPGVVTVDATAGAHWEFRESSSEEEMKRCPVGPIPKYTKEQDIKSLCQNCHGKVLPTLKRDIESRMKRYGFMIKNPVCERDADCAVTRGSLWDYWQVGRCVLTKDRNKNYISECQLRSKIGGDCPGKTSSHQFVYKCDKGLECKFIKEGNHWWTFGGYDYDKYECRDPKRPELTKPQ